MTALHHIGADGRVTVVASDQTPAEKMNMNGARYTEFDRRPGLSFGMYWLDAGADDPQAPHTEDEIYVVINGRGTIEIDRDAHPILPGSVISIPRGVDHRFVDITEDIALVVVFGPPEGELSATSA
jgi:mannose-6-phosphate isomerase-like protein (cupin superfamily)